LIEIFLLSAASTAESDGSDANTQRLVKWPDSTGDARSALWFMGAPLKARGKSKQKKRADEFISLLERGKKR
jgi:hypothetical protein